MAPIPYIKPHATAADRIAHLQSRGLFITNQAVAEKQIDLIGYERLRIYFLSRRQLNVANRPFVPNTTWEHIVQLYEGDIAIRQVCFDAVGQFELQLRNAVSEVLSNRFGSHPYTNPAAFKDTPANLEGLRMFADVVKKTKDQRAKHYLTTYSDPPLPAIWTVKEFMTFGATARLLPILSGPVRSEVARLFGVAKDTLFVEWVECLVDLRNACAHHDRLFNRSFQKQVGRLRSANVPTAPPNKLKAVLECLDYMAHSRGKTAGVAAQVSIIIGQYPAMRPAEAGY